MNDYARIKYRLLVMVCIFGPALVALIPMAAAPALPAMAQVYKLNGDGRLFSQLVMTVPAVMLIVCSPITGLLAEKFGVRCCMLIYLLVYTLSGAGILWVDDAVLMIIMRLLLGVAGGGVLATSLTLIGSEFSGKKRESLLGYATAASSILATVCLVLGGMLVDLWGWRASFALYFLGLPVMAAAWFSMRPDLSESKKTGGLEYRNHKPLVPMWPYYLVLSVLTIGMFTPAIQGGFFLEERNIDHASERGLIIGATSFVAIFTAAFYGKLRDFFSADRVLVIVALSMGSGLVLLGYAQNVLSMVMACAMVGIGAGMSEPAIASLVLQRTPMHVHGLAMGLIVSALNSGQFLNPLIMSQLGRFLKIDMSIAVVGIFILLLALIIYAKNNDSDRVMYSA